MLSCALFLAASRSAFAGSLDHFDSTSALHLGVAFVDAIQEGEGEAAFSLFFRGVSGDAAWKHLHRCYERLGHDDEDPVGFRLGGMKPNCKCFSRAQRSQRLVSRSIGPKGLQDG